MPEGTLYGVDIRDPRGTAPLNPRAFGELATRQPEFESCMASRVRKHVFGAAGGLEHQRLIREAFTRQQTMRSMMRAALLAFARERLARPSAAPPSVRSLGSLRAPLAPLPAEELAQKQLLEMLENECTDCHHSWDGEVDAGRIQADTARRMLDLVAYRAMPATAPPGLDEPAYGAMMSALLAVSTQDPEEREAIAAYYRSRLFDLRVHQPSSTFRDVQIHAGIAKPEDIGFVRPFMSSPSLPSSPSQPTPVGRRTRRAVNTSVVWTSS
jgi:hypothetical protein